ncbi:MAG: sulfatase-like hydrolase/transferase [Acholeplasma sp.]|nr:sulfatase-like hydrolase/transferase [Acholeplasma sp.]
MKKLNGNAIIILTITSFIVLLMLNRLMVTAQIFNPGMNLYNEDFLVSLNASLGDLGVLLALIVVAYLVSKRKATFVTILSAFGIGLSVVVFSLKIYSFYYGTAFSFFNARTFSNSAPVLGHQLTVHLWRNLFKMKQYIAIVPAFFFLYITVYVWVKRPFKEERFLKKTFHMNVKVMNVFILSLLMVGFSQVTYQNIIKASFYEENRVALKGVQTMGLYNYYINDLLSYTLGESEQVIDETSNLSVEIEDFLTNAKETCPLNYLNDPSCVNSEVTGLFEGKKLVILQLESFNDFVMNLSFESEDGTHEVTPFLNQMVNSEEALYFDHFYSHIGVGKTSDAEFATLTGLSATGQIVTYFDYIADNFETLPSLFAEKGYETYAMNGSTETFYKRNENYPTFGFNPEHFAGMETLEEEGYYDKETETINGWVDDTVIFEYLTDVLRKDEQQFIFALTTILHTPYFDFEGITGINPWETLIEGDLGNYLDYARRTDKTLEAFFNHLFEESLLEDVVFVLYGDHTGGLTVDDLSQLYPNLSHIDYQELSHNVPFILYAPGMNLQEFNIDTSLVRGQTDTKRTLSNLFNLDSNYHFGTDMLSNTQTFAYNPMTMDLFTDNFHLILPSKWIDNAEYEERIEEISDIFYQHKRMNDAILKYRYFDK